MTDRTAVVSSSSLFADLDGRELAAVAGMLQPLEVEADEVMFRQGTPGDRMYIVTRGRAQNLQRHIGHDGGGRVSCC